jgi:hypothetical protein
MNNLNNTMQMWQHDRKNVLTASQIEHISHNYLKKDTLGIS